MTPTETVQLVAFVSQISPAQKLDEFTADSWHELLDDLPFGDALAAVKRVGRRQPFIAPADIRAEVRVIRRERLDKADSTYVPPPGEQSFSDYQRGLLAHRRAVGDGAEIPEPLRPIAAPKPRALDAVFRRPPSGQAEQTSEPTRTAPRRPISAEARAEASRLLADAARAVAEGRDPYAAEETGS